jgi:hypothetical protein
MQFSMRDGCQLYRHFGADGSLLYVGISLSAVVRLAGHNRSSKWANEITRVEVENLPSREEAEAAETVAIQKEKPKYNIRGSVTRSHGLLERAIASAPESEDVRFLCDFLRASGFTEPLSRAEIQKRYRARQKGKA